MERSFPFVSLTLKTEFSIPSSVNVRKSYFKDFDKTKSSSTPRNFCFPLVDSDSICVEELSNAQNVGVDVHSLNCGAHA